MLLLLLAAHARHIDNGIGLVPASKLLIARLPIRPDNFSEIDRRATYEVVDLRSLLLGQSHRLSEHFLLHIDRKLS